MWRTGPSPLNGVTAALAGDRHGARRTEAAKRPRGDRRADEQPLTTEALTALHGMHKAERLLPRDQRNASYDLFNRDQCAKMQLAGSRAASTLDGCGLSLRVASSHVLLLSAPLVDHVLFESFAALVEALPHEVCVDPGR